MHQRAAPFGCHKRRLDCGDPRLPAALRLQQPQDMASRVGERFQFLAGMAKRRADRNAGSKTRRNSGTEPGFKPEREDSFRCRGDPNAHIWQRAMLRTAIKRACG
jgi:hypothetical protein